MSRPRKTEKRCVMCGEIKSVKEFYSKPVHRYDSHCKTCRRIKAKELRDGHPDRMHGYQCKAKHGVTLVEYNQMLERQNHKCAICGRPDTDFKIAFAIDHDHVTGRIRGLLCMGCNRGLGYFQDNKDILAKALEFLTSETTP